MNINLMDTVMTGCVYLPEVQPDIRKSHRSFKIKNRMTETMFSTKSNNTEIFMYFRILCFTVFTVFYCVLPYFTVKHFGILTLTGAIQIKFYLLLSL